MASPMKKSSSSSGRPPTVKFARRTSSGRIQSLTCEEELDIGGDYGAHNDFNNYTVMMPPTPDNQPMGGNENSSDPKAEDPNLKQRAGKSRGGNDRGGNNGGGFRNPSISPANTVKDGRNAADVAAQTGRGVG